MLFVKVLLFYIVCLIPIFLSIYTTENLTNIQFFVWGPGLYSTIILPVQYFYVKYSLSQNDSFKFDITKLDVQINAIEGKIYAEIVNRHDDSFIVKYQLYRSVHDISISVLYDEKHVAESPYKVKGLKHADNCYCPLNSLTDFKKSYNCSNVHRRQISNDFQHFKNINMDRFRSEIVNRFNQPGMYSLCHYIVKDNKIYRRTFGEHVGFKLFSDEILLSLARKIKLPDLELFINLGDWPLSLMNQKALPVISWCGSNDTYDLILPTYEVMHSMLHATSRYSLDTLSVQGNRQIPWQDKSNLAFFRGRDSSQERLDLVRLSVKMPLILDARLINMFFFKHTPDLGDIKQFVPFHEFFQHKYQISMDGTVAAYRLAYLFAANSLVFKQDSKYYEHYYDLLEPDVHFVPFNKDLSDLLEKLQWSMDNDKIVRNIINNANKLIDDHLNPIELFCYHVHFLEEYSNRLVSKVEVLNDMELVEQPGEQCDCRSDEIKHKEL